MDSKTRPGLPNHRLKLKTIETQSTFPDDVVEEILSRLLVKQLLQLRCVSKSWCRLIDSPSFIKKQHEKQYAIFKEEGDVPLFLETQKLIEGYDPTKFYLLSKRSGDVLLNLTPDLERDSAPHAPKNLKLFRTLEVAGFVNGVALLVWAHLGAYNSYLGLWNPATRDFKVVRPHRPRSHKTLYSNAIALGFDPKSNDFKVIRSIIYGTEDDTLDIIMYEIYSLNKDTWKSIRDPHPNHEIRDTIGACDVYINGVYYWSCEIVEPYRPNLILSFDFSDEVFKVLDPPFVKCHHMTCVGKYIDSLAVICTDETYEEGFQHYEFWVMTSLDVHNHGIPSSWKHLFTFGPVPESGILCFHSCRMDGDVLIRVDEEQGQATTLYNPTTNIVSRRFGLVFRHCSEYVESLFRLSKRHVDI